MRRSAELGALPGLSEKFSREQSLEMFRRMSLIRCFDFEVARVYKEGKIYAPIYLCIGQEALFAAMSTEISGYAIFTQHRDHSVYLAFGGDQVKMIDELLGRPTGCSFGRGGSNRLQDPNIHMFGHHGLIGENAPLAVGYALGSGQKSLCVLGDASAEEDYVLAALGFAATHKLPVLFVCDDNDLSILTPTHIRRNWEIADVARSFNIPSVDITDDPWLIAHHTRELVKDLPAFINCRSCRHYWHTGVGIDGPPEWDRLETVKQELSRLGIDFSGVEDEIKESVQKLWKKQLEKQ